MLCRVALWWTQMVKQRINLLFSSKLWHSPAGGGFIPPVPGYNAVLGYKIFYTYNFWSLSFLKTILCHGLELNLSYEKSLKLLFCYVKSRLNANLAKSNFTSSITLRAESPSIFLEKSFLFPIFLWRSMEIARRVEFEITWISMRDLDYVRHDTKSTVRRV